MRRLLNLSTPWKFRGNRMPFHLHAHFGTEIAHYFFHRSGLHAENLEEKAGAVRQMCDSAGKPVFSVDKGISGLIYLRGMLRRRHHDHIGKNVITPHNSELTHRYLVRIDHELLPEELRAIRALAMAAYREDIVFEQFPLFVIFTAAHINLRIKHRGGRIYAKPRVAHEAGMPAGDTPARA